MQSSISTSVLILKYGVHYLKLCGFPPGLIGLEGATVSEYEHDLGDVSLGAVTGL